ncbi:MAG: M6 family metalloprotease domain-containing protein [candidate division Zixibacteria bacterium]|nr:M6 family metalloprotease domain-containing protein [candidate division Zixibacteria bacterium]
MMKQALNQWKLITITTVLVWFAVVMSVNAIPPHPQLRNEIYNGKISVPYFLSHSDELREQKINVSERQKYNQNLILKTNPDRTPVVKTKLRALCLLVKFSDQDDSVPADYFDSLLFDSIGNSIRTYYGEVSYNQLDIVTVNMPSSVGWIEAPQTYDYYVNNQNGTGAYPNNTQKLCEDLVDAADGQVDFSNYDNDDNGTVDLLIIVHTGPGAEYTGQNSDIWSHKWGISPRLKDGVYISDFTVQPEYWVNPGDMTVGVYAHELGHGFFGLPDLYDIDGSGSHGIGKWGLMSYGCWLGPSSMGSSPAHPCAWSKIQMGFTAATIISDNSNSHPIGAVETSDEIYRLWNGGSTGNEYFLIENRQKTGFDSYIPGSGLLIWHIDDTKTNNTQEWWLGEDSSNHYMVALEQSDGLWELEHGLDYGDDRDPFPGNLNNLTFDALSTPNSNSYQNGISYAKVDNISPSANTMYADFTVGFIADNGDSNDDPNQLPTTPVLSQNYPNPFNPSTTIEFTVSTSDRVTLEIFNLLGRKVKTLLDEIIEEGTHTIAWNGTNKHGQEVASGVYLYRIVSGGYSQVRKMTLLR